MVPIFRSQYTNVERQGDGRHGRRVFTVQGNLSMQGTNVASTDVGLTFTGPNTQTVSFSGGNAATLYGPIQINKTGGAVDCTAMTLSLTLGAYDWMTQPGLTMIQGTFLGPNVAGTAFAYGHGIRGSNCTFVQQNGFVGMGAYTQTGGALTAGSNTLFVAGNFSVSGGTFKALPPRNWRWEETSALPATPSQLTAARSDWSGLSI